MTYLYTQVNNTLSLKTPIFIYLYLLQHTDDGEGSYKTRFES